MSSKGPGSGNPPQDSVGIPGVHGGLCCGTTGYEGPRSPPGLGAPIPKGLLNPLHGPGISFGAAFSMEAGGSRRRSEGGGKVKYEEPRASRAGSENIRVLPSSEPSCAEMSILFITLLLTLSIPQLSRPSTSPQPTGMLALNIPTSYARQELMGLCCRSTCGKANQSHRGFSFLPHACLRTADHLELIMAIISILSTT